MMLSALLRDLPPTGLEDLPFPAHLLGAFRRKSITFCSGVTDETTIVYWFQSRSFTIDLRLPDADATPLALRQGWIGDTIWDAATRELFWQVSTSYQPRNQWPEPATFATIGNSLLEFAPSGAYVEDWRQIAHAGPYLGLRLIEATDEATGSSRQMSGGLVLAGKHIAFACSRDPAVERIVAAHDDLEGALASDLVSEADIESYEVSVALEDGTVDYSTDPGRRGQPILSAPCELAPDGSVTVKHIVGGTRCVLRFAVDHYVPDHPFVRQTPCTPAALAWMERERSHLMRHASVMD